MALSKVFVYGSLMCPDVLKVLLERVPFYSKAYVKGFQRLCVKNESFPACRPKVDEVSSTVEVFLLQEINEKELEIFDAFEDKEYTRQVVEVNVTTQNAETKADIAYMYVWNEEAKYTLEGPWSFEQHYLPKKKEFLKMCQEFINEYKAFTLYETEK
eukprot:CAMPEP_0204842930 /NCGR_PEP_ID=MMETSP1346-20131115/47682_1 /ASSEMBLY_ACC=CAM_ASM_000771 /TAXON_ID=215587 /ORGANISM="Aplanochytrium stocchinoi, Strain GSBS06" /LENGTH=156 /DNA_ID=CAMNT_0051981987 /DNA_START=149 /DNA_END=620 /DNA_ORIENTATION=+